MRAHTKKTALCTRGKKKSARAVVSRIAAAPLSAVVASAIVSPPADLTRLGLQHVPQALRRLQDLLVGPLCRREHVRALVPRPRRRRDALAELSQPPRQRCRLALQGRALGLVGAEGGVGGVPSPAEVFDVWE